ncbi:alpha-galactosidase A precursor [Penicillium macrosclerotiorum]|uniref:alpha-galactosidase A precursor n=1 Tax=Penicillium macrosclerotiorum TaxID=303699 RepID=UPI0025487069|nr:alpha-galactosidase A precursor [Penicillium macrosclerotiorum]KAJ5682174.1 alpha-galactosidase A precursor [Penicillium macrosclerotiorum]
MSLSSRGIFSTDIMCFGPSLISSLPKFPPGDWNDGRVAKNTADGRPFFASIKRTKFPGVQNTWHETYVEYLDLSIGEKLLGGLYEAKHLKLFDDTIVVKFARFPWEIQYLENETTAYQWISGHEIGPQFLGHVTENGRVIGFLMEHIANARHAGPKDLDMCRKVLRRLHDLGIRHGDTNPFNFLIQHNCKATLIDFDTAEQCDDQEACLQEYEALELCLQDDSGLGGVH